MQSNLFFIKKEKMESCLTLDKYEYIIINVTNKVWAVLVKELYKAASC